MNTIEAVRPLQAPGFNRESWRRDLTTAFGRWRLQCPYGKWICSDGREILFNRYYCAIWERYPGQQPRAADPSEWVPWVKQEWFVNDGNNPASYWNVPTREWRMALAKIDAALAAFGLPTMPPRPAKPRGRA